MSWFSHHPEYVVARIAYELAEDQLENLRRGIFSEWRETTYRIRWLMAKGIEGVDFVLHERTIHYTDAVMLPERIYRQVAAGRHYLHAISVEFLCPYLCAAYLEDFAS